MIGHSTVVITGASSGIGRALAQEMARGGHALGLTARRMALLEQFRDELQAAYCASKAGFSMYLESARIELRRKGIVVTDILPGYIETDIVEGVDIGKLPFAIPVEQAASEMARLVAQRVKSGVVPAVPWKPARPFLGHLPERFTRVLRAQRLSRPVPT